MAQNYTPALADPFSRIVEAACEAAIKRAMNISDVSPRRLLTVEEAATYLTLSEREIYNMIATGELVGVKYGKRRMLDIQDLNVWISEHKGADAA